ncbi:uncharacterized protein LOC114178336 isoform X2 [Vigna unguiculata]|uniref:uncharacterized protein LOC114162422 isoform X2 n=1 Tax=Vigna unguiculata TaxID=3917 RepID=UPI001016422C|nr:uncharacterized protein LOC114162422 isoform X2 [Vigna unguiculata]XP_027912545.1 uncharacterized protein LOC114171997 isoform X2 [Vigna unguiculata]XP_027920257.1 uncharacterized protein LOC114178336 isoform X2 [Vigna unguiculata]
MHICGYVPPWLCQILACMGSCLGCFPNPPTIKGQGMSNISEDFWSSSALEIDQRAFQSQKSVASIGLPSDPQSSSGIQIDSSEFVNDGLLLWNQMRRYWVRNKRSQKKKEVGEPLISWNTSYENLMGTDKAFPRPIPLGVSSCMHWIVSSHFHVHDRKWLNFLLIFGRWKDYMTKQTKQGFFP